MGRSCINIGGNTTQGQNLGGGAEIYAGKVGGTTLSFKSLAALGGISITNDSGNIYISADTGGGGALSASNGLSVCGDNIVLGGDLTGNTVINGNYSVNYGCLLDRMGQYFVFSTGVVMHGGCDPSSLGTGILNLAQNSTYLEHQSSTNASYYCLGEGVAKIVADDICLVTLPAKTTETCVVYVDANGKLASGVAPTGSGGTSYTFTNGVTETSGTVKLGGTIGETTEITVGSQNFCITGSDGDTDGLWMTTGFGNYFGASANVGDCDAYIQFNPTNANFVVNDYGNNRYVSQIFQNDTGNGLLSFTGTYTITDANATPAGLKYALDYSATFDNESLVTKRYVDACVTGGTGGTSTPPGGSDGQVQYNNGGSFGGSQLYFNDSTNHYGFGGAAAINPVITVCDTRSYEQINEILRYHNGDGDTTLLINNADYCEGTGIFGVQRIASCTTGVHWNSILFLNSHTDGRVYVGPNVDVQTTRTDYLGDYCLNSISSLTIGTSNNSSRTCVNGPFVMCGVSTLPTTPVEGEMVRLKNHTSCADGIWIYTGASWISMATW